MALYNNGFPAGYQPAQYYTQPQPGFFGQPQYQQQFQQQPQYVQPERTISGFDWVLGAEGAKAYNVPAGKTYVLFDADPDSNHFFLKSTDVTGKPNPAVMFDYEQHKEETKQEAAQQIDLSGYVPVQQFESLKKELETLKAQTETTAEPLTAEDVREIFDQLMEQRFARVSEPKATKRGEKA